MDFEDIARRYTNRESINAISASYGLTTRLIRAILREKCVTRPERLPPAKPDVQRMADRYLGGETLQQVGDAYGFSREHIRHLLKKHGVSKVKRPYGPHKKTNKRLKLEAKIIRLINEDVSPKEIMRQTGVSYNLLASIRRAAGISVRGAGHWLSKPHVHEKVCELYVKGASIAEICKQVPELAHRSNIYRHLELAGIPTRGAVRREQRCATFNEKINA